MAGRLARSYRRRDVDVGSVAIVIVVSWPSSLVAGHDLMSCRGESCGCVRVGVRGVDDNIELRRIELLRLAPLRVSFQVIQRHCTSLRHPRLWVCVGVVVVLCSSLLFKKPITLIA